MKSKSNSVRLSDTLIARLRQPRTAPLKNWSQVFLLFFPIIFLFILKMISRIPSLGSFSTLAISFNSSLQWKILRNSRKMKSSQGKAIIIFLGREDEEEKWIIFRSNAKMFIITIELCGRYLISEFRKEKTLKHERLIRHKKNLRCSPHLRLVRLSHVVKTKLVYFSWKLITWNFYDALEQQVPHFQCRNYVRWSCYES